MKILIIQQKMIGDVLTSSILFEILRKKYPNAQLDYLIEENTIPVIENNPFVDNILIFNKKAQKDKRALIRLGKYVRSKKYDVLIDVYSKLSSNVISVLSNAKTKISYHKPYTKFIYDHNIKRRRTSTSFAGLAITNRLQLLDPLNITEKFIRPKIYLKEKEIINAKTYLNKEGVNTDEPLFMISVLGSDKSKTYPFQYMAKVIDTIALKSNGQILFNYIPKQVDEAQSIYKLCAKSTQEQIRFDVFGKSLRQFLAITYHCSALIGNEGGAVNMAKALDAPTFTIFSPWIKKTAWNMFDNDTTNISVHLRDFKPNLYTQIEHLKELKSQYKELYLEFIPDLFSDKLEEFLKQF